MTDVDEGMLTAAKLAEQIEGRLDSDRDLAADAGVASPDDLDARLFLSDIDGVDDSSLLDLVRKSQDSRAASKAVHDGDGIMLSHLVGVTESDLEADQLSLASDLVDRIGSTALTTALLAGEPNTGKTNFGWLLVEIARRSYDRPLVISNARASATDLRIGNAHDLMTTLIEHQEKPKVILIDEGSRHFDARTKSYEVSSQWTPLHKSLSKLGVVLCCVIGHTGKDVAPEVKRITNLAAWKPAKDRVELYDEWPADDDRPAEPIVEGTVDELEKSDVLYSPDDPASWSWNLDPDVFDLDADWSGMLDYLERVGPQSD